jgi:hypothetical protein
MIRSWLVFSLVLFTFSRASAGNERPHNLFNGKDLTGWEGDPAVWSVEDGAIVGRTSAEKPLENNTFLIWKDGEVANFRLRLEYRIEGGNSGVQYRSKVIDPAKWIVGGYQADIDSGKQYTGILYDEQGRGILTERGKRGEISEEGEATSNSFAEAAELQKEVRSDDWNKYVIEALGPRLRHVINGKLMSETVDRDKEKKAQSGVLALQVHKGPPMTVRFRNIQLVHLDEKP